MQPTILGDPHLGKVFKNGVPLNRRGDREKSQWLDFRSSLNASSGLHICVGDLFDTFVVPYSTVLKAAQAYKEVARKRPNDVWIVMRGNHDGSRIAEDISAYMVFAELLRDTPNVIVLEDDPYILDRRLFVPWHPFNSADSMVASVGARSFDEVYGHWDVQDFGGNNPNLVPLPRLRGITGTVFTGHEHKKQTHTDNGLTVIRTGSMQPYAHGEDAGEMYRTLDLKDLEGCDTKNLCLRVRLRPGEKLPEDLDCYQVQTQLVSDKGDDEPIDVQVEDFDLRGLFDQSCDQHEVNEPTREKVWENFNAES